MDIPISNFDFNLWLVAQTILLLITLEIISPKYQKTYIIIDKKRFKKVALFMVVLFSISVVIFLINNILL